MADPSAPDAPARFAEALPVVFDFRSPRIYTAAYGELQNSGDLGLIQDQALRLTLAEFESLLEGALAIREDIVRDEWIHRVRPVLGPRLPSELYQKPEDQTQLGIPKSPFHPDFRELVNDLELWNLITHRLIVASGSREAFLRAREVAGRLVSLTTP
jgi:hypothetical protein